MRRLSPFALSAGLHLYLAIRLIPSLLPWPAWAATVASVLAISAIAIPLGWSYRRRMRRFAGLLTWSSYLAMGFFSSLFVLTVLRDLALLVMAVIVALNPGALPFGDVERWSALAVSVLAAAMTLLGFRNARRTARVKTVDVPIAGLPSALHGFTIAQISDIHVGPTIRGRYVSSIVARVNALEADLVAVTGDLVDGSVAELRAHVAPLAELSSRHGTFFVTGNHEYYSGVHAWIRELSGLGIRVLVNEHVVLRHEESALVVAGVTDTSAHHFEPAHRSSPERALAGAPEDATVRVLLAHQPQSAEAAADAGFHLQLSGHTHGGQFWPWNYFVRMQQPFVAGLARVRDLWIYTSRGTGYWGPPIRLGAPSEITRVRLVAGN
jgi:predicted MPP superfamily phosphohydrolase